MTPGKVKSIQATTLESAHWLHSSFIALTKKSISEKECTGDGVILSLSVPLGTVG